MPHGLPGIISHSIPILILGIMKRTASLQSQTIACFTSSTPLRFWVEACTQSVRPRTAESYQSLMTHLRNFFGHEPALGDIANEEACRDFTEWLLQNMQASSARTYLAKLRSLLKKAYKKGLISFDPSSSDGMVMPRLTVKDPTFLTIEQVVALERAECPHESTKQAFLFSVHTGLRLSDIETLEWSHISLQGHSLRIVKEQVKTKHIVRVPLSDKAVAIYSQLKRDPHSPRVFGLLCRTTISSDLRAWARNAALDLNLTFHVARHTFVTILLQSEISIYTASRLCGHTQVSTTERYAHLSDPIIDNATRSMNNLWSRVIQE